MTARADYATIGGWVDDAAHVLDLGCGDGALLAFLAQAPNVIPCNAVGH